MTAVLVFSAFTIAAGGWSVEPSSNQSTVTMGRCPDHHAGVRFYRERHSHWLRIRGVVSVLRARAPRSCADARYLAVLWRGRARAQRHATLRWRRNTARRSFNRLYEKWRCIHEHEGAWNSNTGNGYYGGLQMDISFQLAHGRRFYNRWGTADRWPVWAQLAAAEDAYRTRGFNPWPNTARMCGLL